MIFKKFKNINFNATLSDIDEFVDIDNENSQKFLEEILEEAYDFFGEQQAVYKEENITSDKDEPMDICINS